MYIFIDESGDLGFKKSSSKWFVIVMAVVSNKRLLEHVVHKVWKSLKKKHRSLGELHASHEKDITRTRMMKALSVVGDLKVVYVAFDKTLHLSGLNAHDIYNELVGLLIQNSIKEKLFMNIDTIDLVIDKKDTKKKLQDNLVKALINPLKNYTHIPIKVSLRSSHGEKSLQATDFIAWAVFRKHEHQEVVFYTHIQSKIVRGEIVKKIDLKKESPPL